VEKIVLIIVSSAVGRFCSDSRPCESPHCLPYFLCRWPPCHQCDRVLKTQGHQKSAKFSVNGVFLLQPKVHCHYLNLPSPPAPPIQPRLYGSATEPKLSWDYPFLILQHTIGPRKEIRWKEWRGKEENKENRRL